MLSLIELERVAAILEREVRGQRIQALAQPDAQSVVLEIYGGEEGKRQRRFLSLCCDAERAHVGELESMARNAPGDPRFGQYLRAHIRGARIVGVELLDGDRQLALRLETRDGPRTLLLAVFGRRSNLWVLDEAMQVLMNLRPLSDTRPELSLGSAWQAPSRSAPRPGEDRFAALEDSELLAAIHAHYAAAGEEAETSSLRRRLETALRKELKSLDRKLDKTSQELAKAEAAAQLERQGELLKSALDRVKRGDVEVVVEDWDSGEPVHIELDPILSPAANLERLFKRYRKGVRALTKAGAQQDVVQGARDAAARLGAEIAALADEDLAELAEKKEPARLLAKYAPGPPPAAKGAVRERKLAGRVLPARLMPRRYRTAGDLEIWVGRSDAANDYLSTRLARGKDLFFHVAATPGSHVILRTGGRDDPPSEAVLDACELAVHYSKARKASRVDVHVVPIKNVRKPKGSKPGLVEVHGGKNLHLRREEARLRRVLDARIEDA